MVSAAAFFSNPTIRAPSLSPDGKHVVGIRSIGATDQVVVFPADRPLETREVLIEKRSGRPGRASRRISSVGWPGNDRIVYAIESPFRSTADSWQRSEPGWSTAGDVYPPAGASFGAITDLVAFTRGDSRGREVSVNEHLIGESWADRSRLRESSPVEHLALIKAPVFLGHGAENPKVDQLHTIRFSRALRKAGGAVETHLYPAATQIFIDDRDRIDFYRRLADFFARKLIAVEIEVLDE